MNVKQNLIAQVLQNKCVDCRQIRSSLSLVIIIAMKWPDATQVYNFAIYNIEIE